MSVIEHRAQSLPRRPLAAVTGVVWARVRRAAVLRARRRSVVHMARLDDHLLADIGLTRAQVADAIRDSGLRRD